MSGLTHLLDFHPDEAFVAGTWQPGTGGRVAVVDPATEEVLGHSLDADAATVAAAVAAARRAFDDGDWSERPLEDRVGVVEAAMRSLADQTERLALGQTAQMGVPITVSRAMLAANTHLVRAYVEGARDIASSYLRRDPVGQSLVVRRPVGVVAAITPWNGPLATVLNKVVPSLLAGCTVVLKPAPETPLEAVALADALAAAGLPAGVLNVVTGGVETGRALVAHPAVDKVTFTGSSAAGRSVGEVAGRDLKRQSLELGGKSAAIVLDDADLDVTVPQLAAANFFNSGQACIATTRVLVPAPLEAEILPRLVALAEAQVVGDPRDPATQLGPLVNRRQHERVLGLIEQGRREGARLLTGGDRPPGLDRGCYVRPAVFAGVRSEMTIAREEIFGPVMSVLAYSGDDEAVRIANDSPYGLHGAVFGRDLGRAMSVARQLVAGSVGINSAGLTPATPYGGLRASGIGREHGREGVEAFLEYHSYVVPASLAADYAAAGVAER